LIIAASAVLLFGGGSAQRKFGDEGPFGDDDGDDSDGTLTLKAALKQGFVDVTGVQANVSKHIRPQFRISLNVGKRLFWNNNVVPRPFPVNQMRSVRSVSNH
jgi:hypothetical protein